jgi:hypothetical protein
MSSDSYSNAVRRWVANKLASLARRIYPQSPEVMAFWSDRFMDMAITGNSFVKVTALDPKDVAIIHGKAFELYDSTKPPATHSEG